MTQSAMKRKVLNGVGGLIKKAPHVFEVPTIDDTCVGNSTTDYALSFTTAATAGELVYLNSSAKWALADSDGAAALQSNMLGIVMESGVDGDFVLVALKGSFVYAATVFPTFTIGVPLYVSATPGAITATAPSADITAVRVIGYAVHADKIFFDPTPPRVTNGASESLLLPTVDGTSSGLTTSNFVSGYTTSAVGDLVYLASTGKWLLADSNGAAATNANLLGIAMSVAATDVALTVALSGSIIYSTAFPTFTIGSPVFMSETAGAVTHTAPSADLSNVRKIGHAVHADKLYFEPDNYFFLNGATVPYVLPTVDTAFTGPCFTNFVSGYTTSAVGDVVILASTGKWVLADANTASLYNGLIGIAMTVSATDAAMTVAVEGAIVYATAFPTLTIGTRYWISETPGTVTGTMPTTGTSGQVCVGVALHADKLLIQGNVVATISGA